MPTTEVNAIRLPLQSSHVGQAAVQTPPSTEARYHALIRTLVQGLLSLEQIYVSLEMQFG